MVDPIAVLPPSKELAEYRKEILGVQKAANEYEITSKEDLERGDEMLSTIKNIENVITSRKEEITRPLMQALASARDLFKPLELGYADAKKVIKSKMLAYQIEDEARIEKEQASIEKKVESGRMKPETAAGKLEVIQGSKSKVTMRKIVKVRIIDETAIPREYLVPDMTKITEAVIRQNAEIPGVEKYTEKSIVTK